jgi:phosphohistidine phosphatase SixA
MIPINYWARFGYPANWSSIMKWPLKAIALAAIVTLASVGFTPAQAQNQSAALLERLREPGHFAIMRHTLAPGTGDPRNFRLDDCKTQRNLSATGRDQARSIGQMLRQAGITRASVYSSQWCRCMETARLLGLGPVTELAPLNSFFEDRAQGPAQTAALRNWLANADLSQPVILVSHAVNVTALSGVSPSSGEIVIMRSNRGGGLEVVGSVRR